ETADSAANVPDRSTARIGGLRAASPPYACSATSKWIVAQLLRFCFDKPKPAPIFHTVGGKHRIPLDIVSTAHPKDRQRSSGTKYFCDRRNDSLNQKPRSRGPR